jgi:hypothetical protein
MIEFFSCSPIVIVASGFGKYSTITEGEAILRVEFYTFCGVHIVREFTIYAL